MPKHHGWAAYRGIYPSPPQIPWATGRFYTTPEGVGTTTVSAIAANFRAVPLYIPNSAGVTITSIGIEVTTAGTAGHVCRIGIYSDTGGKPGVLLHDSGAIPVDPGAVPTFESNVVSWVMRQGWYWVALAGQSGTVRAINASTTVWGALIGYEDNAETTQHSHLSFNVGSTIATWMADGLPGSFPAAGLDGGGGSGNAPRILVGV